VAGGGWLGGSGAAWRWDGSLCDCGVPPGQLPTHQHSASTSSSRVPCLIPPMFVLHSSQAVPGRAQGAGAPGGAAQVGCHLDFDGSALGFSGNTCAQHVLMAPGTILQLCPAYMAHVVTHYTSAPSPPRRFFFQGAGDWADAVVGQLGAHADSLLPLAAHQADAMLADAGRVSPCSSGFAAGGEIG